MNGRKKAMIFFILPCVLSFMTGCLFEEYNILQSEHPLGDKAGFFLSGKLEDGTEVSYQVRRSSPLSFQVVEEVTYKKDGSHLLVDYNADEKVDRVLIGKTEELLGRGYLGFSIRYNKVLFTESKAKEILHDADRIFNRVKVELKVSQKMDSFTKAVKNPFR